MILPPLAKSLDSDLVPVWLDSHASPCAGTLDVPGLGMVFIPSRNALQHHLFKSSNRLYYIMDYRHVILKLLKNPINYTRTLSKYAERIQDPANKVFLN